MKNSTKKKKTGKKITKRTGRKDDAGKAPVMQFLRQFPNAIEYVSRISEYGHKEYGKDIEDQEKWDNWKYVDNAEFRYTQALGRHALEKDGSKDLKSGFLHIGHAAWNALAVLEKKLTKKK